MQGSNRVLVAGAINTDLVARVQRAPEAGQTITGRTFGVHGGGKGANQALASARSGSATAFLGALGQDDFGRQRLEDLGKDLIHTDFVHIREDAPSGVALITVEEASGQNRIAYIPGATLSVSDVEAREAIETFKPTTVLTTLELPAKAITAMIETAKAQGARVIMNATPEPGTGRQHLRSVDVVIANETEALGLLRLTIAPRSWFDAAKRLTELGPTIVIITLGKEGAIAVVDGSPVTVPAPQVRPIDTTGAGDALCGAFASAMAAGLNPEQALKRGVAAGSAACLIEGAQRSMPTTEQIDEFMRR